MPELPEVETVVRDLRPLAVGRIIRAVRSGKKKLRTPWKPAWNARIAGMRIEGIRRRGKWIIVELASPNLSPLGRARRSDAASIGTAGEGRLGDSTDDPSPGLRTASAVRKPPSPQREEGSLRLLVHLGMTGRFSTVAHEPAAHRHLVLTLDDGAEIHFFDPRRFGSITLHESETDLQKHFQRMRLGPEPLDLRLVPFCVAVINTTRNLKAILLDQQIVAGLGNIYVNESCHLAKVHPSRRGNTLTQSECRRLVQSIKDVIRKAIQRRGTTLADEGYLGGGFQKRLRAYDRAGQPCRGCSTSLIERIVISGRATYFCPTCQPR